jgi:hypothetical protein
MKIVYRPVLTGNRRWRKIFPFCTGKILESVPHIAAKGEFDMVVGQSEAIRRKPAPDGPLLIW